MFLILLNVHLIKPIKITAIAVILFTLVKETGMIIKRENIFISVDNLACLADMMPMRGMPTFPPLGGFFKGGEGLSVQRMGGPSLSPRPRPSPLSPLPNWIKRPQITRDAHQAPVSNCFNAHTTPVWVLRGHEHLPIG